MGDFTRKTGIPRGIGDVTRKRGIPRGMGDVKRKTGIPQGMGDFTREAYYVGWVTSQERERHTTWDG